MPSDPSNWAELKATLANWLAREDLSAAEIPEAIALAERRFQRTLFSIGCVFAIIESRPGWARALKQQGYEPYQVAVRKAL